MKKLLTLPSRLVDFLNSSDNYDPDQWLFSSDPPGARIGSGGGSAFLIDEDYRINGKGRDFDTWLNSEQRVLIHAGGESRRLPAYSTTGKVFTPVPVYRWATGQRIGQDILSLQLPLFEKIFDKTPASLNTMIASGDVLIRIKDKLDSIPEADIVCFGMWSDTIRASQHGVFLSNKNSSVSLDFMLQKPSGEDLVRLSETHYFLLDIGLWLLNERALKLLMDQSRGDGGNGYTFYDLYGKFGLSLGANPIEYDPLISQLTTKIVILDNAEFYHFGTNESLISSVESIQNLIYDQRVIKQSTIKPPVYVQNSEINIKIPASNNYLWIENSFIGSRWEVSDYNIITGIPENNWSIKLKQNICIDVVPVDERHFAVRPYDFYDKFRGALNDQKTFFMGKPFRIWLQERELLYSDLSCAPETDIQEALLFPICDDIAEMERVIKWMIYKPRDIADDNGRDIWIRSEKISAHELMERVNLERLFSQRDRLRDQALLKMTSNWHSSVFYQIDLEDTAKIFVKDNIDLPQELPEGVSKAISMRDNMFRSRVLQLRGEDYIDNETQAFTDLQEGIKDALIRSKILPQSTLLEDQIVWARSAVRLDLAGGWTDTPPYCLSNGGSVINMAIELNDQPPVQVFIRPNTEYQIVLRSIDMGAEEVISEYDDLDNVTIGSPFSIPKTALKICGFHPQYSSILYSSLKKQLSDFGHGIDITLLSAIPAGTGLGTSSILSATVLGALNDFCNLNWDRNEICMKTLVLEQLLTTGGGWQDQFGAILPGIKHLVTNPGFNQTPIINWLPDNIFKNKIYQPCHLLYYTGINRSAKTILEEIVKGMFLNDRETLDILEKIKECSFEMAHAIQKNNFELFGSLVGRSWDLNKKLDPGVTNVEIDNLISKINDLILGCKLVGAGGGGYLYIVAKDPEAAAKVHSTIIQNNLNVRSRFGNISLSDYGLQISRS